MEPVRSKESTVTSSTRDLAFLSAEYKTKRIPKEKKYLRKYFKTPLQMAFLKYFLVFGDYTNFIDHTGLLCQEQWLKSLHEKLMKIEQAHHEARTNPDMEKGMETLALIERGKYKP